MGMAAAGEPGFIPSPEGLRNLRTNGAGRHGLHIYILILKSDCNAMLMSRLQIQGEFLRSGPGRPSVPRRSEREVRAESIKVERGIEFPFTFTLCNLYTLQCLSFFARRTARDKSDAIIPL